MTTYICKCGRRVKKSTDASTTGNRLSGYAPGHECWGCPYAMPYGNYQWDESARTVSRETQGYECRMSKTLTYASEFAGSIKDKCTCRVHSLDFDFLSQVSAFADIGSHTRTSVSLRRSSISACTSLLMGWMLLPFQP